MKKSVFRLQRTALIFCATAFLLSACGTMPSGYTSNAENNDLEMPAGYKYTPYRENSFPVQQGENKTQTQALHEIALLASRAGWTKTSTDLALAIDDKIGLKTQQLALVIDGDRSLAGPLEYYMRESLQDLLYRIVPEDTASYVVYLDIGKLDTSDEFEQDLRMAPSASGMDSMGNASPGPTSRPSITDAAMPYQDIRVETVIELEDETISRTRSAHRLFDAPETL